jgi:hypothetical protein
MVQDDLCALIAANGYGVVGTNIFSYQVESPDDIVVVRVYDNQPGEFEREDGFTPDEKVFAQLLVRGRNDETAETKARAIHDLLHFERTTLNGKCYHYSLALQRPVPLKRDEKNRAYYVFNLELLKEA